MKHYGLFVEDVTSLPAYDAAYTGRLLYVITDNTLYYGGGGSWNPIGLGLENGLIIYKSDGLADWRTWNIYITGGTGNPQTFNIRLLDDARTGTVLEALILGNNSWIRTWEVDADPDPSSEHFFLNNSGSVLGAIWRSTAVGPDVAVDANGRISAGKVFNSIWNDIVDFLELEEELDKIEYGKVYTMGANYKVSISSKYADDGIIGIASNTYGFGVGSKNLGNKELPVSIGGFVLAYVDNNYLPGTPLTSSFDGYLTEILPTEKLQYPERIIATYLRPETNEEWNGVKVHGRHWVKVR